MIGKLETNNGRWSVLYTKCLPKIAVTEWNKRIDVAPESALVTRLIPGKMVEFKIVNGRAKLKPNLTEKSLQFLANQAQELDMGYDTEWAEFFEKSEQILNQYLPLRYKNWLKNTYTIVKKSNMNHEHHIQELERKIDRIKSEPVQNWLGHLGKSLKIKKIEMKIRSLKKKKHGKKI